MKIEVECAFCNALMEVEEQNISKGYFLCPACGHTVLMPRLNVSAGMDISGFEIERYLGSSFTGLVFLARQISMNRPVALKVLAPVLTVESSFIRNFIQQVIQAGSLRNPYIVPIYDAGESDEGIIYVAMRYVDGPSLAQRLEEEGALPEAEALALIRPLVDALEYAWREHQILHQDLKPSSILVDDNGEPQLVGLGASYIPRPGMFQGDPDLVIGSPHYMSPERTRGEEIVDVRTDIYSIGATLYELVTGELPFPGHSIDKVRKMVQEKPVIPPRERNPNVSSGCSRLIEVAMAKKPKNRYLTWQAFIQDLDTVMDGLAPKGLEKEPTRATPPVAHVQTAASALDLAASHHTTVIVVDDPKTIGLSKSGNSSSSRKKSTANAKTPKKDYSHAARLKRKKRAAKNENPLAGIVIVLLAFGFLVLAIFVILNSSEKKPPKAKPRPLTLQDKVGGEMGLRQAENHYRQAELFESNNPDEYDRIIAKYKAVEETSPDRTLAEKARRRIDAIQQSRGDR